MNDPSAGVVGGPRRPRRGATLPLAVVGLLAVLGLAAAGTIHLRATGARQRTVLRARAASAVRRPQTFTVMLKSDAENGRMAPDGEYHDAFQTSEFDVHVGVPVTITVYNYDDMPHSFTAPTLGVDQIIPAGDENAPSVVTFTFTPTRAGTFWWYCATPCDGWAMTHFGYMVGKVTVTP